MIQPNDFPTWQFTDHRDSHFFFNYKSPRLKQFVHFLSENYNDDKLAEELIKHEEMAYLTQVMWPVAKQLQAVQDDIRRQVAIHIKRGLPLPPELEATVKLKLT